MRTAQRLAALGVVAAIVLSGCSNGKDSYSSAEKEESGQPLQSASISASSSVESAELAESANAGYPTLKEVAQNYNGCALEYPNMEELSVGMLYGDSGNRYCLFDVDGRVHHVFESDTYIASGFYNGMCMTSRRTMVREDGTTFWPSYVPADEVLVAYLKNECGILLWTVKQEDTLNGSKTILTAWNTSDGSMRFQCDTTQPEFEKNDPVTMYKNLTQNLGVISYEGAGVYMIIDQIMGRHVEIGIYKGTEEATQNYYVATSKSGNIRYISVKDGNLNKLSGWNNLMLHRGGNIVLSENLIFLDAQINEGGGTKYPTGFYDVHLNQVIDLSKYNIQSIYEDEPRFINGYAFLQMKNPEGVPFWGVIKRDGTWAAEPQKGSVRYVYQTAEGVLITTCEENIEQWYTYDQTGTKLDEWDRIKFDGSYGYAQDSSSGNRGICEVYNGYTYASLNSHVAKISSDGSYEYLS